MFFLVLNTVLRLQVDGECIDRLVMFLTDSTSACSLLSLIRISFIIVSRTGLICRYQGKSSLRWSQISRQFLQQRVCKTHLRRLVEYRIVLKMRYRTWRMSLRSHFWIKTILLHICFIYRSVFTLVAIEMHADQVWKRASSDTSGSNASTVSSSRVPSLTKKKYIISNFLVYYATFNC